MGVTVGQEDFVTWKTGALFLEVIHFGLCISIFCFKMASSAFFTTGVKGKQGGMGVQSPQAKIPLIKMKCFYTKKSLDKHP